ncbi:MAG: hypothetical protein KIT10_04760 [Flavobacteriales bacterium]|nr:hypothetical protein [Flavobacteriales bacterium]
MIKFFRSIRQSLLAQGRFTRYLTYAVGEILLVVIGIFLALQLNNWNAERKRSEQELALLIEMRENLLRDLEDCRDNIITQMRLGRAQEVVLKHLEERTPFHDSLRIHYGNLMGSTMLTMNTSAYDNLKSIGFDLIRNDSLRSAITRLYSERYRFVAMIEIEQDFHLQKVDMGSQLYEKVVMDTMWKNAYPVDVDALMNDNKFKGVLRMNKFNKGFMVTIYEGVEQQVQELIAQIDKELEQRRK